MGILPIRSKRRFANADIGETPKLSKSVVFSGAAVDDGLGRYAVGVIGYGEV